MRRALLWNTYGGDVEWFKVSARSYRKFAGGWDYAKCIVPNHDKHLFEQPCAENGIYLAGYDEWPGKGFLHHMAMHCMGDLHFPDDVDVIFHIDSDCVFAEPSIPEHWIVDGKILLPFMDFSEFLKMPVQPDEERTFMGFTGKTVDFQRGQYWWKFATDFALGWNVRRETMAWMPLAYTRETYEQTRALLEARHRKPFQEYIKGCRNEFPQSFCEFNTLGAVAHKFFESSYCWWNLKTHGYPFQGKVIQCWSHGGFDRPFCEGKTIRSARTPRELFAELGLL